MGALVSLSLMLRAAPAAALLLSDDLLRGGADFSAPQRMPFLLWTLAQAARCSLAPVRLPAALLRRGSCMPHKHHAPW